MNESLEKHRLDVWREALVSALSGTAVDATGSPTGVVNKAIDIADYALIAYEKKAQELL